VFSRGTQGGVALAEQQSEQGIWCVVANVAAEQQHGEAESTRPDHPDVVTLVKRFTGLVLAFVRLADVLDRSPQPR
jgi:hypothetical protein